MEKKGVPEQFEWFLKRKELNTLVVQLILSTRNDLRHLYKTNGTKDEKRAKKKKILSQMTAEYEDLKKDSPALKVWDGWFAKVPNNAQMPSVSTYNKYVAGFNVLLKQAHGDLEAFYEKSKVVAELSPEKRREFLEEQLLNAP